MLVSQIIVCLPGSVATVGCIFISLRV